MRNQTTMTETHKAGAIILSELNPSKIALIYRLKHDDWTFPKGHVEDGESAVEAAIREVSEETGLSVGKAISELPPMEYGHPNGDRITVRMFLMRSEDDSRLKPEFEGDQVIWIDVNEVVNRLSYGNLKGYFSSVLDRVKQNISAALPKKH